MQRKLAQSIRSLNYWGQIIKSWWKPSDDPDVKNVTCYISRAKTGGIKGGLLAEDTSDAAISCQQVGPIELSDKIKNKKSEGSVVFQKRTSLRLKSYRWCVSTIKSVIP